VPLQPIKVSDEVLEDTVQLARRYINDRYMPDKAIDLLDETSAYLRVNKGKTPPELRQLQKELKLINTRIDDAVDTEDYEKAAREKQKASQLSDKIKHLEATTRAGKPIVIGSDDMAVPESPAKNGRLVRSYSWVPPASVRPSWLECWLGSSSVQKKRWSK
jgi:ATP-dependent Clp protease ATP-binding subunit ClpA